MPKNRVRDVNEGYQPPVQANRVDILPGLSRNAFNLSLFVDPGTPSARTISRANQIVATLLQEKIESRTLPDYESVEAAQNTFAQLADINYRLSSHTRTETTTKTTQPPKTGIARALSALVIKSQPIPQPPERSSFGRLGPEATQVITEGEAAVVLNGLGVAANILENKIHTDPHAEQDAAAMRELRRQIYGPTEPPAIQPVY